MSYGILDLTGSKMGYGFGISGFGMMTGIAPIAINGAYQQLSFTPYGVTINHHIDWSASTANSWWNGPFSGGEWNNRGGSLDVMTTWSPWTGNYSQSFDLRTYESWGSYFNGPGLSISDSNFHGERTYESHNRDPYGSSDQFVFSADNSADSTIATGTMVQSLHHDDHRTIADIKWNTAFQNGHVAEQRIDKHDVMTVWDEGFFAQSRQDSTFHEANIVIADITPPWMFEPSHDWMLKG